MSPQDALKKLKGSNADKRELFDFFVDKAVNAQLEDWEGVMLEAVKKELFPKREVVEMSAVMRGLGSAGI
jgi:hypothetical protein